MILKFKISVDVNSDLEILFHIMTVRISRNKDEVLEITWKLQKK